MKIQLTIFAWLQTQNTGGTLRSKCMHWGKNPDPTLKQAHATTPPVIKTEFAPPSIPKLGCSGGQKLSPIFNHSLFTLTYSCCQHCPHIFFPCLIPDTDFFIDIPILFCFANVLLNAMSSIPHQSFSLLFRVRRASAFPRTKLRPQEHEFDCMEKGTNSSFCLQGKRRGGQIGYLDRKKWWEQAYQIVQEKKFKWKLTNLICQLSFPCFACGRAAH